MFFCWPNLCRDETFSYRIFDFVFKSMSYSFFTRMVFSIICACVFYLTCLDGHIIPCRHKGCYFKKHNMVGLETNQQTQIEDGRKPNKC